MVKIHPLIVRITHWINAFASSSWLRALAHLHASPFPFRIPNELTLGVGSPARCSGISPQCGCW